MAVRRAVVGGPAPMRAAKSERTRQAAERLDGREAA